MKNFVLQRCEQFLNIIDKTIYKKETEIDNILFCEGKDTKSDWQIFAKNSYWGKNDTWYCFKTDFEIPADFDGEHVKMRLVTGRENLWNPLNPQLLVRVNGAVVQGLDTNHKNFTITKNAKPGEKFVVEFEAYSGREYDNISFHDMPLQFVLSSYCHSYEAEKLYYDLSVAKMAAEMYPESNTYRLRIEEYLNNALNCLDCRNPGSKEYFESVIVASKYMQEEFYEKYCGHDDVIADCIGHTHIDVAWLWRTAQTKAKAVRSFATELSLIEEYPEHRFSSSQPQLYKFVKQECPEIYEKIKECVKKGTWEVEGAMWLEADCNLISGESLIRQILHGKRFMKEEFDVESKVLWLPDVFGYSAALPQILKKCDVETFVTSKIHWNETNHFPYDTFIWKGIDGSEIFTQFITSALTEAKLGNSDDHYSTYNSLLEPVSLAKGWEIYHQKNINNEILVSFGYGDGGGGVTREMIERSKRLSYGIPGTPKARITTIDDTIERIKNNVKTKKVPKWFGELYLELHRGTYTSIAKNKLYNRLSEFLLQHTESVSVINKILLNGKYDKDALYSSWETVLLNQFHDIIPGSSIKEVYEDSAKQYEELIHNNTVMSDSALGNIANNVCKKGLFVYNPVGTTASGIVDIDGKKQYVANIPAYGWKVIEEKEASDNCMDVSVSHMENDFYLIEIDDKGTISRIYDKINDREVLNGRGNVIKAYDDHPKFYDNWEISNYISEKYWELDNVTDISVAENTDVSASIKIERKYLSSTLIQTITIYRDIQRIDFETDVDWNEHHMLLKAEFPVDILADKATYEIQYGALERPTHTNTSWDEAKFEVCAHKWVDYSEPNYGVALLNDCKYGHDIHDGVIKISLIKCGTYPNPDADIGKHHFKYSLVPHKGNWREACIVNQAYAFNCPLIAKKAPGTGLLPAEYSLINSDKDNIIISTVKEACDSEDIVVRVYEACGQRTKTTITLGLKIQKVEEINLIETQKYTDVSSSDTAFEVELKPFEIKTFKIGY